MIQFHADTKTPTNIDKSAVEKQKAGVMLAEYFRRKICGGLIDKSALTKDISEADYWKNRLLVPQTTLKKGPPLEYQILVANGNLEAQSARVDKQLEIGDNLLEKLFIN